MSGGDLEGIPLFAGLAPEDRARAAAVARRLEWDMGHVVLKEGEFAFDFYAIKQGAAEVLRGAQRLRCLVPGTSSASWASSHTMPSAGPDGEPLLWSLLPPPRHLRSLAPTFAGSPKRFRPFGMCCAAQPWSGAAARAHSADACARSLWSRNQPSGVHPGRSPSIQNRQSRARAGG